jgi:hypothetical protein
MWMFWCNQDSSMDYDNGGLVGSAFVVQLPFWSQKVIPRSVSGGDAYRWSGLGVVWHCAS